MTGDRIRLEGMVFFGHHGTIAAERELGQRFVVDVALTCELRAAGESDDLQLTVDYSAVHGRAKSIVEGTAVQLTETLAERIAAAVLAEQPLVQSIWVRVVKPNVRLGDSVLAGSAVEIVRSRADTKS